MELCTTRAFSNLHHSTLFTPLSNHLRWKTTSIPFKPSPISRTSRERRTDPISMEWVAYGSLYFINPLLRASISKGTPSGADQYMSEERDGVLVMEDIPATEGNVYNEIIPTEDSQVDEQTSAFEFLDKLNIKIEKGVVVKMIGCDDEYRNLLKVSQCLFDTEDPYSILLFGSGALTALWFASAIVGAIDSIPIFPKLMEVVGLGYTLWFSARYLIFKRNRDELAAKIEELKQQVLGSEDD